MTYIMYIKIFFYHRDNWSINKRKIMLSSSKIPRMVTKLLKLFERESRKPQQDYREFYASIYCNTVSETWSPRPIHYGSANRNYYGRFAPSWDGQRFN